jgi:glutamyl-tRNA synthetase
MILGPDGEKMSKRHGAVSVMQYRDDGYLPEALLNYLARLGWSHGDQEIFSIEEMIALFDVTGVHSSAASFDPAKLAWLNQHYIKTGDAKHIARHLSHHLGQLGIDPGQGPDITHIVDVQRERAKTLREMAEGSVFFFRAPAEYDPKDATSHLTHDSARVLSDLRARLAALTLWTKESVHETVTGIAAAHGLKLGKVAQPLRVALAGRAVSPPIDVTLGLLGREESLRRIDHALAHIARTQSLA